MAQAELKIAGDSEKAQQSIVALEKKIEKLEGKLKGVTQRTKQAGAAAQQSFGGKALSSVTSYAAGFVSLTGVIAAATQALQYHNQVKKESAQRQRASQAGLAELAQLASTPEQMQNLVGEAYAIHGQGVGKTVDEAAGLLFSLESATVKDPEQRQMFVDLAANSVVGDVRSFAFSSRGLIDAFGEEEAGDFTAVASKAFAASAASPSTVDQLLAAASGKAGTIASQLKISDEELLAAVATVASSAGGASEGSTQIEAMMSAMLTKGGFEGLSMREAVQKIDAMGLEGEDLVKYFGRKEGMAGFGTLLQNLDRFDQTVADIEKAEDESRVFQRIALPSSIPEIAAAQSAQAEENQLNISRNQQGAMHNLADAAEDSLVRAAEEGYGLGIFERFAGWGNRLLLGDEQYLNEPRNRQILERENPELLGRVAATLERMERQNATIAENTKPGRTFKRNE